MGIHVVPISDVAIRKVPGAWPLPENLRAEVPMRWARMLVANPNLWDGRILGVGTPVIGPDQVLRTGAREDAYSAFLAWREAGFPPIGIANLFGTALILSSDGYLVFGMMADTTANAGLIYPPGGSLEPRDVGADGMVDVKGCIATELEEETGLSPGAAQAGGLVAVFDGPRIAVCQVYRFDEPANIVLARIRENLARQAHRELADVMAVRRPVDAIGGTLAPYAAALLDAWQDGRISL